MVTENFTLHLAAPFLLANAHPVQATLDGSLDLDARSILLRVSYPSMGEHLIARLSVDETEAVIAQLQGMIEILRKSV